MLFLVGINSMSKEEKIALLAQINALTGWNALSEGLQKGVKGSKNFVLDKTWGLMEWLGASGEALERVDTLRRGSDWDADVLRREIERQVSALGNLPQGHIDGLLRGRMVKIAGLSPGQREEAMAAAIIHRAARALKISPEQYTQPALLEEAVFEACIKEQIDQMKKKLESMSPDQMEDFEGILRRELEKLSQADWEAVRLAAGLDKLSSKALISFLKATSGTALAQLAAGALGFGAYLFLTTFMHAISLLLGMTFSFGVYTAATSALAFALSGPLFLLVAGLSGGYLLFSTSGKIDSQLAKMLVISGRAKLLGQP